MKITTLQKKIAASFIFTKIEIIKQTHKCKINYSDTNKIKFINKFSNFEISLWRTSKCFHGSLVGHGPLVENRCSSRKAWSILNNVTGSRSRHSPRHCPVSANAIASQLVRNKKYEAVDRKSSRLVSQEVSDLWRATTPDAVNIFDNFSQREFAAALQHLKPSKTPGLDSICSELILHAGATLKAWLRDFLFAPTQNSQDLQKSACSHDPKTRSSWGTQKLSTNISALCPLQDPREAYLCPR